MFCTVLYCWSKFYWIQKLFLCLSWKFSPSHKYAQTVSKFKLSNFRVTVRKCPQRTLPLKVWSRLNKGKAVQQMLGFQMHHPRLTRSLPLTCWDGGFCMLTSVHPAGIEEEFWLNPLSTDSSTLNNHYIMLLFLLFLFDLIVFLRFFLLNLWINVPKTLRTNFAIKSTGLVLTFTCQLNSQIIYFFLKLDSKSLP